MILLLLVLSTTAMAQDPKGADWDRSMAAYLEHDWEALHAAQPALERAYPGHLFAKFFDALYKDQTNKDNASALIAYTEVLRQVPSMVDARYWRSVLLKENGEHNRALADLTIAIQNAGSPNSLFYRERGINHFMLRDYKNAKPDFVKSIEIEPRMAENYLDLANTLVKLGEASAAEKIITDAYDAQQTDGVKILAIYAKFLVNQERYTESLVKSRLLIASGRKLTGDIYNVASIAAYHTMSMVLAKEYAHVALLVEPANADILVQNAIFAFDQADWTLVRALTGKALAIDVNSAAANKMMGEAIWKSGGSPAEAKQYLDRAKALGAIID